MTRQVVGGVVLGCAIAYPLARILIDARRPRPTFAPARVWIAGYGWAWRCGNPLDGGPHGSWSAALICSLYHRWSLLRRP